MEDRREHPRMSVLKGATLFYRHGTCSISCVILDQSESGVKVRIDDLFNCPPINEFEYLHINDKPRACRCVWINKNELGFVYTDFIKLGEVAHHA